MARVTVEDCIKQIPNRFELVLSAAQRSRGIARGDSLMVKRERDKNTVVALREIADELISKSELKEDLIRRMQRVRRGEDRSGEETAEAIENSVSKPLPKDAVTETHEEDDASPAKDKDEFTSMMDSQMDSQADMGADPQNISQAKMPKFEDVDPDDLEE